MDITAATRALAALSQTSRLEAFRLLVKSGADGVAAGKIAEILNIPHNTLSTHLATLVNAGLAVSRRESRSIIYRVDFDGTRELLSFLVEDCCQGRPEACLPALESVLPGCCKPDQPRGANP